MQTWHLEINCFVFGQQNNGKLRIPITPTERTANRKPEAAVQRVVTAAVQTVFSLGALKALELVTNATFQDLLASGAQQSRPTLQET
jgi:hypothetical protein